MEGRNALMRGVAGKLAALPAAMLLVTLLWDYPFQPLAAALLTGAYCALLCWRPRWWLLLVPAALPWLDLSPWSGRFYIDELDLMLLATQAVGYWRLSAAAPDSRLPRMASVLLGLVFISTAVAAWRGLQPWPAFDLNSYANYLSPCNSLRVAKGTLWALLLLPLLRRAGGPVGIAALLVPGMLLGLLFTGLAVMWERSLFPGLLNFSSDYRPTAPFAAMHTGGAALDAYLAMSFPFVAWWLLHAARRWQMAVALALMLLGLFTGLTLFSRDVWLAYGAAAAVLAVLHAGPRLASGRLRLASVAAVAVLMLVLCGVLALAFSSGGYRVLGTLLVLWAATLVLGGLPRLPGTPSTPGRPGGSGGVSAGVASAPDVTRQSAALTGAGEPGGSGGVNAGLAGVSLATAALLGLGAAAALALLRADGLPGWAKGPYFAFLLTAAVGAAACLLAIAGPAHLRRVGQAAALGAYLPLAGCAVLVAWHWGGTAAARDAALAGLPAVALLLTTQVRQQPLWVLNRASISLGCAAAAVLAAAIPILASSYMEERMSTVERDWQLRVHHWGEAVRMMPDTWDNSLFGVGLGRYPATYYWHNLLGEQPGSYRYESEPGGNRYLRLLPPQHPRGYGDPLRHLQRLPLLPHTAYVLEFDARRYGGDTRLSVAICRRWLLYPQDCMVPVAPVAAPRDNWQHYRMQLDSAHLGSRLPGLAQLELAAFGEPGAVDIDNISLRSMDGAELLRNGSFARGQDGWFFSSDRDHLPWHIKNLYVHTYFEQGWLGAIALALLLLYTGGRLAARGWAGRDGAAVYLAALSGALVVGAFDSLFDVPRLTLLFFLLLVAALLKQYPLRQRQRRAAPA